MQNAEKFIPGILSMSIHIEVNEGVVGDAYTDSNSLMIDTSKSKLFNAYIENTHATQIIAYELQYSLNPLDATPTWKTIPSSAGTLNGVTIVEISKNCIAPAMRIVVKANTTGQTPSYKMVARVNQ